MGTAIGALFADIGANSAAFAADMGKAERSLKSGSAKMNRSLGRLDKGFLAVRKGIDRKVKSLFSMRTAIVSVVGGGGLGLLIKRAIDTGDTIAKVADSIGVSTDFLQEYRFAAGRAGVETRAFDSALQAAAKRVGEARAGTGTLITILKKMDPALLAAVQGAESMEQAMDLIIKKGASLESHLDRAALFAAAFGRTAGVEMANLIRNGAGEIDEMRAKARELGLVIREDLLRDAEEAKDRLGDLGLVLSTTVTKAILENADAIADLATEFTNAIPQIIGAVRSFGEFVGILDDKSALETLNLINDEITRIAVFQRGGVPLQGIVDPGLKNALGGIVQMKDALPVLLEARERFIALAQPEIEAALGLEGVGDGATKAGTAIAAQLSPAVVQLKRDLENLRLDQASKKFAILRGEIEKGHNVQLDQAAKKWAALKVEIDKNAEAQNKVSFAAEAMGDSVGRSLQSIINRSNSAAGAVRNLAFELGNAILTKSIINPVSNRASGFFRNLLGFQHGGEVTAGGSGGPDSQVVGPFRVSPREKITFTPPGQAAPARGGGGASVTYNIYAPGADVGTVQRIKQVLEAHIAATPSIAVAAVNNSRARAA